MPKEEPTSIDYLFVCVLTPPRSSFRTHDQPISYSVVYLQLLSAFTMAESKPFPVTVHPYPSRAVRDACLYELGSSSACNALLFVGGLGDGPHTVPYIRKVAAKAGAATGLSYSVFETRIRSSFSGFGWNSLANDVEDISDAVKYLRSIGKDKIVLMGHSTGSQVGTASLTT